MPKKDPIGAKWREHRRTIMSEVIMSDPNSSWSITELHNAMLERHEIIEHEPTYSRMTCWRDWKVIRDELSKERHKLAGAYIANQLETTDALIDDLFKEYEELDNLEIYLVEEAKDRASLTLRKIKAKENLIGAIDKLMARQQSLLPVAVPRRVEVDSRQVTVSLDRFQELQNLALMAGEGKPSDEIKLLE